MWINSLIQGAGGNILDPSTVEAGRDAKVTINSEAGKAAAAVIEKLAQSNADAARLHDVQRGHQPGRDVPRAGRRASS